MELFGWLKTVWTAKTDRPLIVIRKEIKITNLPVVNEDDIISTDLERDQTDVIFL